jgi:hypothetical protein
VVTNVPQDPHSFTTQKITIHLYQISKEYFLIFLAFYKTMVFQSQYENFNSNNLLLVYTGCMVALRTLCINDKSTKLATKTTWRAVFVYAYQE